MNVLKLQQLDSFAERDPFGSVDNKNCRLLNNGKKLTRPNLQNIETRKMRLFRKIFRNYFLCYSFADGSIVQNHKNTQKKFNDCSLLLKFSQFLDTLLCILVHKNQSFCLRLFAEMLQKQFKKNFLSLFHCASRAVCSKKSRIFSDQRNLKPDGCFRNE